MGLLIVYEKTDEWYTPCDSEWKRVVQWQWQGMTTSGTESANERQRMTASDNKWQRVITNDNEWYNK